MSKLEAKALAALGIVPTLNDFSVAQPFTPGNERR